MMKHRAGGVASVTPAGLCNFVPASECRTQPLVTIGIPTFNRAFELSRAVASCQAQGYPNLEIVISDNASTDSTSALCDAWSAADPRIRVIHQAANIGRESNFGAVLAAASGDFFMWLSDDDWLDPRYVSACAKVLIESPDCAMVGGNVKYFSEGGVALVEPWPRLSSPDASARVLAYLDTVGLNGTYYSLMRHHDVCRAEYPITFAGDWYFVAQMAAIGKVTRLPYVTLYRSDAGISRDLSALPLDYDMSPRWGREVHLWAAILIVPALLRGRGTFDLISAPRRLSLALQLSLALARRWWHHSGRRHVGIHLAGRLRRALQG
jgi:glycosyltransferase involved in cell wall biosynthesis